MSTSQNGLCEVILWAFKVLFSSQSSFHPKVWKISILQEVSPVDQLKSDSLLWVYLLASLFALWWFQIYATLQLYMVCVWLFCSLFQHWHMVLFSSNVWLAFLFCPVMFMNLCNLVIHYLNSELTLTTTFELEQYLLVHVLWLNIALFYNNVSYMILLEATRCHPSTVLLYHNYTVEAWICIWVQHWLADHGEVEPSSYKYIPANPLIRTVHAHNTHPFSSLLPELFCK